MPVLVTLIRELAITLGNAEVWQGIAVAILLFGGCLLLGVLITRLVGLLQTDAPTGETLAVGLAAGLMVSSAWWAAIWSGGRSSFTPVAVGFALAICLAVVRRTHRTRRATTVPPVGATAAATTRPRRLVIRRSLVLPASAGGLFIVVCGLLYGSTLALSPRDGLQPVEFMDEAFYSVLGRDLAATGLETNLLASGFSHLDGLPTQTWYHWAELWLASAVITVSGLSPLIARHIVILPIVLLATAALTGTLVQLLSGSRTRGAYVFGFASVLFLAPVPYIGGPFFSSWAAGLIFGITQYGLAAVAVILALYCIAVLDEREHAWPLLTFVACTGAYILPAHIVIALLAIVGVAGVGIARAVRSLRSTKRLPDVSWAWRRAIVLTAIALISTVAWASYTGHGLGGSGGVPTSVPAFNMPWALSVAAVCAGAGVLLAIPIAWWSLRKVFPDRADLYLGAMTAVAVGAIAWGYRVDEFNTFHFFFGGLAVIATPVAAIAAWTVWLRIRENRRAKWTAVAVGVLFVVQLEFGVVYSVSRLQMFGPGDYKPVSVALLDAIRQLPADTRLAYACKPFEEVSFAEPGLVSLDAHTGRRVVPMCFQSNYDGAFAWAPQRALYPGIESAPSSVEVATFLKGNGIRYIYADADHPNDLVSGAVSIATDGNSQILWIR